MDWNYSRISLYIKPLTEVSEPYVLWLDTIDPETELGRTELRNVTDEVSWGERHSNELGLLEIISLRLNRALMRVTNQEPGVKGTPIVRVTHKESLVKQGITSALWYEVTEVAGEQFESR